MHEVSDGSVHMMITSPPYFNAPFDYPNLFRSYGQFLSMMKDVANELYRVLADGRIAAYIVDDMLVAGEKYPVVADITKIMISKGFRYRDKITWLKPEGYIRISHRSGIVLQHPYPMYFYPDNIQESVLIFQKGKFDYNYVKTLDSSIREASRIDISKYQSERWYLTVWNIINVLPQEGRLEEGVAAFPEELPRRLINLFTFVGEIVLDPFLGSGTTTKVAAELKRNSIGYEVDKELKSIIKKKIGYKDAMNSDDTIKIIERKDAKRWRTSLHEVVKKQKSVGKNKRKATQKFSLVP